MEMAGLGRAGLVYFLVVFAAAFLLGTGRVLLVEPMLGPLLSVALELPLTLTISWFVGRWVIGRFEVGSEAGSRVGMGLVALVLLVCAESLLGVVAFGQTIAGHFAAYASPRGILTVLGQIGFALMPLVVPRYSTDPSQPQSHFR